jgi:hypothetical protein
MFDDTRWYGHFFMRTMMINPAVYPALRGDAVFVG